MKRLAWCLVIVLFCFSFSFAQSIDLAEAAQQTGADLYWDSLSGSGILEKNGHQISFRSGDPLILMDYTKLAIVDAPENKSGTVYVSQKFIDAANKLFSQNAPETYYKVGAILIDPGHGGRDPGAVGSFKKNGKTVSLQEKDLTLSISKLLAQQLQVAYPDKEVILTRSDDTWLTLEQRVDIANSIRLEPHEAILYISIHINASLDKSASGYEVWYLSPGFRRKVLESTGENQELENILNSMLEEEYTTESVLIAKFIMDWRHKLERKVNPEESRPKNGLWFGIPTCPAFSWRLASLPTKRKRHCWGIPSTCKKLPMEYIMAYLHL